jgi:hypothetical protein
LKKPAKSRDRSRLHSVLSGAEFGPFKLKAIATARVTAAKHQQRPINENELETQRA